MWAGGGTPTASKWVETPCGLGGRDPPPKQSRGPVSVGPKVFDPPTATFQVIVVVRGVPPPHPLLDRRGGGFGPTLGNSVFPFRHFVPKFFLVFDIFPPERAKNGFLMDPDPDPRCRSPLESLSCKSARKSLENTFRQLFLGAPPRLGSVGGAHTWGTFGAEGASLF